MMIISNKDKELIKKLISQAESKTQSELVPMIVHHSDVYPAAHFRAAIIISFLFSLALYFSALSIINPIYFLWIQLPGLYVGYLLGHIPFIKRVLITKEEIEKEVTEHAYQSFFHHNLHLTQNHNGVLLFVSVMEKKIKIIADVGISKKIDQKIWEEIIFQFAQKIKEGQFIEGLTESIQAVSNVLETYAPADGSPKANEIKNDLIVEN